MSNYKHSRINWYSYYAENSLMSFIMDCSSIRIRNKQSHVFNIAKYFQCEFDWWTAVQTTRLRTVFILQDMRTLHNLSDYTIDQDFSFFQRI